MYTAENGALAILEVLQYADVLDIYSFSMLTIDIPDGLSFQQVLVEDLPDGWHQYPHITETKEIGKAWIDRQKTLLLRVPSAVYPEETNLPINPEHPDAKQIRVISIKPVSLSDRLFKKM